MADSAKHSLSYPKYFHFSDRCYWKVYSCGRSLDNPTHGIPLVTWKKTQAWFPRSGDNHLLNGFEASLIFSTLWTGRILVRRCPSWKHFRRWWGFMCWPGHHIVRTSNPPHRATGQGLSVGCTALRGWSYICWKPRYMGCTILWFKGRSYIRQGRRYTSEVGPFICQSHATLRNVVEPRGKRIVQFFLQ